MKKGTGGGPGSKLGFPVAAWAVEDRRAWQAAFGPGTSLERPERAENMAPNTKIAIEIAYASWLRFLSHQHPGAMELPAAERATEARVIEYLHSLKATLQLRTILNYGCRIRDAMEILAPASSWRWFEPILDRIEGHARKVPAKARPFVPSDQLFAYGIRVMGEATDPTLSAVENAEWFRDGLMIAFLAARPLRRADMISLAFGTSIFVAQDGYGVEIDERVYKTRKRFEFTVPESLLPYIQRYLTHHRPVLASGPNGQPGCQHVWLARSGAPIPSDSFADAIAQHMWRGFKERMTPHDFRHCAATTIANDSPKEADIIRIILGHASPHASEKYYNHSKGIKAIQIFQDCITARRKAVQPWPRRRPPVPPV